MSFEFSWLCSEGLNEDRERVWVYGATGAILQTTTRRHISSSPRRIRLVKKC